MLTSITTSLDCDNYDEVTLAALLEDAKTSLPSQLLPALNSIPEDQRLSASINILGIRLVMGILPQNGASITYWCAEV